MDVAEAVETRTSPMEAALKTGLENLSANQVITFTKYVKLVLPLDGFVFWVRADLLSQSALLNAGKLNGFQLNQPQSIITPAATVKVKGSLHFDTRTEQGEEETYSINRCVFTSEERIDDFNEIGPQVLYIAQPPTPPFEDIRFAFSSRGPYYQEANLYHYLGDAVYADMQSQIIDSPAQLLSRGLIVSNSLPIWLSMSQFNARGPWETFSQPVPLYPSFLSPDDLHPPFATVHIDPGSTEGLAQSPTLGKTYSHDQLSTDKVKIAFYGIDNSGAMNFIDFVEQYCQNNDDLGLLNIPIMRDEKRPQSELSAIAMKKSIIYRVSYLQSQSRSIARQLILKAIPSFIFPDP